jgi:hypothetical protein
MEMENIDEDLYANLEPSEREKMDEVWIFSPKIH